jgi:hypothetical protein
MGVDSAFTGHALAPSGMTPNGLRPLHGHIQQGANFIIHILRNLKPGA